MKFGFLFQRGGAWIGVHYSNHNKRLCINLIPFCTLWICLKGGNPPCQTKSLQFPQLYDLA